MHARQRAAIDPERGVFLRRVPAATSEGGIQFHAEPIFLCIGTSRSITALLAATARSVASADIDRRELPAIGVPVFFEGLHVVRPRITDPHLARLLCSRSCRCRRAGWQVRGSDGLPSWIRHSPVFAGLHSGN